MILVHIARDVRDHFPARRSEWVLAGMMVTWGWFLLKPDAIFQQSPAWAALAAWASEPAWGWAALSIGVFRLAALVINGTFHNTWYGRYSPHVRAAASFASCFIWMQLTWGLMVANYPTTGLAIYPGLLLLDLMNVVAAATDAGKMDKARRDAT